MAPSRETTEALGRKPLWVFVEGMLGQKVSLKDLAARGSLSLPSTRAVFRTRTKREESKRRPPRRAFKLLSQSHHSKGHKRVHDAERG